MVSEHSFLRPSRVLRVTINRMWCSVSVEALHQVFDPYGEVEKIEIHGFQATIEYRWSHSASVASIWLQGRCIYDGCCQLDIHYSGMDVVDVETEKKQSERTESIQEVLKSEEFSIAHQLFDEKPKQKLEEVTANIEALKPLQQPPLQNSEPTKQQPLTTALSSKLTNSIATQTPDKQSVKPPPRRQNRGVPLSVSEIRVAAQGNRDVAKRDQTELAVESARRQIPPWLGDSLSRSRKLNAAAAKKPAKVPAKYDMAISDFEVVEEGYIKEKSCITVIGLNVRSSPVEILPLLYTLMERHFGAAMHEVGRQQLDAAKQHAATATLNAINAYAEWAPLLDLAKYGILHGYGFLLSSADFRLHECVDVTGAYSSQKTELNTSLIAIGLLWTTADFIANLKQIDAELDKEKTSDLYDKVSYKSPAKDISESEKLLFSVFSILQWLGADERPKVRNAAVRILFQTLGSHGHKMLKSMWEECLWNYVFPALDRASHMAATSSKDESQWKVLGSRGGKAFHTLIHHSRNIVQKQWDETLVLVLGGIARLLQSFFPFLSNLDNFFSGWESLLYLVRNSIFNGSKEVVIAAIDCLQTTVVSHIIVEEEKKRIAELLRKYVDNGDAFEACRCILGVSFFHHEVVRRALTLAMENGNAELLLLKPLKEAPKEDLISSRQMVKGFARWAESLGDLAIDIPESIRSLEDLGMPEFKPLYLKKLITLARDKDTARDILDASNELALFLARAWNNDVLAPLNLEEIGSKLPLNCSGRETVDVAWSLIVVRHAGERLFVKMVEESLVSNEITMLSLIIACGFVRAIQFGRRLHAYTLRSRLRKSLAVSLQLVDPLGKTGHTVGLAPKDDLVLLRCLSEWCSRSMGNIDVKDRFYKADRARIDMKIKHTLLVQFRNYPILGDKNVFMGEVLSRIGAATYWAN